MDLKTKLVKELVGHSYYNPKYSSSGKELLLSKANKGNTKLTSFYIFNLDSEKKRFLFDANKCLWITK